MKFFYFVLSASLFFAGLAYAEGEQCFRRKTQKYYDMGEGYTTMGSDGKYFVVCEESKDTGAITWVSYKISGALCPECF